MSDLLDYVINDDFFKSIKEEITCSICLDIKIDPIMCTKCQNSYCSKCIKDWEKKSNQCPFKCDSPSYATARVVKNLISKQILNAKMDVTKLSHSKKFNHIVISNVKN